ncbi:MAG: radical SAM protein [Sedimentisphaerales bacterium]
MSGTDIVLIDPPDVLYKQKNTAGLCKTALLPHLGLLSIAAVIAKQGYSVKYIDSKALGMDVEQCCNETIKYKPRYVGITATTPTINFAAKVANRLKAEYDPPIIIGGAHVSGAPVKTMEVFKSFDIGVVKEGEVTILELLEALDKSRDLNNVKGIIYRNGERIVFTEPREYIADLNTLPFPAWHLLPDISKHYRPNYMSTGRLPSNHIITSRGCYGKCIFCDKSVTGERVRAFDTEYVLEMIGILYNKYGIRDIQINDDSFLSLKKRTHIICDELIKRKWDLTFSCDARVNNIDRELMVKLKRAGFWQIAFGIESGSQEILDFIKKGITLEQVEKAVTLAKEVGIKVKGFFILGHPTETKETIMQTINFMLKLDIQDFGLTFFTPYPGSPFYGIAEKYGQFKESWDSMGGYCVGAFIPEGFTQEELIAYRKLAHRKFYLRPKIICSKIKDIKSPFDLIKFANGVLSFSKKFLTDGMLHKSKE